MKGIHCIVIIAATLLCTGSVTGAAQGKDGNKSCGAVITHSPFHPGICPKSDPGIRCIQCYDSCVSDNDCSSPKEKCCLQEGCGNWCKESIGGSGWAGVGN